MPSGQPTGKSIVALVAWIVLCFSAAAFGSQFMPGEWYAALKKPTWNPPNWIFGPVWSALYTMMAVAAWLVWRRGGFRVNRLPLSLFLIQLFLNALWSWLFFGENPRARLRRNRPALARHQWNDRRVLAEGAHGRLAARAVSGVGQLRLRVELHTLAIEPLKTEQTP